jgi:hypothetical protein
MPDGSLVIEAKKRFHGAQRNSEPMVEMKHIAGKISVKEGFYE